MWKPLSPDWMNTAIKPPADILLLPSPPNIVQSSWLADQFKTFVPGVQADSVDLRPIFMGIFLVTAVAWIARSVRNPYFYFLDDFDSPVPTIHQWHPFDLPGITHLDDVDDDETEQGVERLYTKNSIDRDEDDEKGTRIRSGKPSQSSLSPKYESKSLPTLPSLPPLPKPTVSESTGDDTTTTTTEVIDDDIHVNNNIPGIGGNINDKVEPPPSYKPSPLHRFYDFIAFYLSKGVDIIFGEEYAAQIRLVAVDVAIVSLLACAFFCMIAAASLVIQNVPVFLRLGVVTGLAVLCGHSIGYLTDTRIVEHVN